MAFYPDYASYYNLFYTDKNYDEECDFVLEILHKYGSHPHSLLDLGCGSGRHDIIFAEKGIQTTGIDISQDMLEIGKKEYATAIENGNPELFQGDARTARLEKNFSSVVSLFHVLSYQTTEEDALAFLRTAAAHLDNGGFLFADFWYGPGVLTLRPENREKVLENNNIRVVRKASPTLYSVKNLVNVHYDISVFNKRKEEQAKFAEDHLVRYWFIPELSWLAREAGFEKIAQGGWLSTEEPGLNDWAAWMLLKKRVDR